tara:strand:+ start:129857 stop:130738 length:882 start_codon:yes stop_codon:yes gene_type:complete
MSLFFIVAGTAALPLNKKYARIVFISIPLINIFNKGAFFLNHDFLELQIILLNAVVYKHEDFMYYLRRVFVLVWLYSGLKKLISIEFLSGDVVSWMLKDNFGIEFNTLAFLLPIISFGVIIMEVALPIYLLKNMNSKFARSLLFLSQIVVFLVSLEYGFFISAIIVLISFLTFDQKRIHYNLLMKSYITWPVIHTFVVIFFGISPWRLGGYGMYSTLPPFINNELIVKIQEKEYELSQIPFHRSDMILDHYRYALEFSSKKHLSLIKKIVLTKVKSNITANEVSIRVKSKLKI